MHVPASLFNLLVLPVWLKVVLVRRTLAQAGRLHLFTLLYMMVGKSCLPGWWIKKELITAVLIRAG